MLQSMVTLPIYAQDTIVRKVEEWIQDIFKDDEGVCYYKFPVVKSTTGVIPDLTVFVRTNEPLAIKCFPYQINEINAVDHDLWVVNDNVVDSPLLELEDFVTELQHKFSKIRILRNRLTPLPVLAFPVISQKIFEEKFGTLPGNIFTVWNDGNAYHLKSPLKTPLSDEEWRLVRSAIQSANTLNNPSSFVVPTSITTLGTAIKVLERDIALLDGEQEKVAIQIAPGPQRIRGLAGTGKTVLLAMKAANIHLRFPDKKILFTFHTQSLYNQAKLLISKFYRSYSDADPDWEHLHIRHSWGGRTRPGVYYDLCRQQEVNALDYQEAKRRSKSPIPFQFCCQQALRLPIRSVYDFILIDEAQDFPKEFFQLLFKLSFPPHQIYWAYDELQSLTSLEIPKPEELFGTDKNGKPLVSLEGDDYPGGIEKDFVLHRSYCCPMSILMLAHAIGLGLYSPHGPIQMLGDKESWKSIGYEVKSGEFEKGQQIVIYRPPTNSPNRIEDIFKGQDLIATTVFEDRGEELDWVAASIQRDVNEQDISPEQIVTPYQILCNGT